MTAVFREPDPAPKRPSFTAPPGSCDCHAHIFGPAGRYPVIGDIGYALPNAGVEQYVHVLQTLGLSRAVIVQPHVYGTDNTCLLDALRRFQGRWRGVAVIERDAPDRLLEEMHELGVRGVRINLRNEGGLNLADVARVVQRIKHLKWHLEFAVQGDQLVEVATHARKSAIDVVIPHMGRVSTKEGPEHKGFQALLELVREGRCWIKLSAAHRFSVEPYPHNDVTLFVEQLTAASTDRLLWATDWPHTRVRTSEYMPNDGELLDQLALWVPDLDLRKKILVSNPSKLYGFRESI